MNREVPENLVFGVGRRWRETFALEALESGVEVRLRHNRVLCGLYWGPEGVPGLERDLEST